MTINLSPANEEEWEKFVAEFQNKSDRASAILGAVYLETYIGELIASFFVDDEDVAAKLLDKERPLGNFSTRIHLAYCLGLISDHEYHDLNLIFKIRNAFISNIEVTSFSADGIRELAYRFKIAREVQLPGETRTPRHLFVFSTTMLIQHLALRTELACKNRRQMPDEFMLIDTDH